MIWDSNSFSMESSMWMKRNMPWASKLPPFSCQTFQKEPLGGFWSNLWILIASHGFSIWPRQNKGILLNHTHPPTHLSHFFIDCPFGQDCHVKQGWGDVMTNQIVHPQQLWDQRHQGGFVGVGKDVDDVGALRQCGTFPHST